MKEQLISFDTAKLAKEKGFESILPTYYDNAGVLTNNEVVVTETYESSTGSPYGQKTINDFEGYLSTLDNSLDDYFLAPTQSLLQKWLREVHSIIVVSVPYTTSIDRITPVYIWMIYKMSASTNRNKPFKSYEEALEKGLQEALKLI